MKHRAVVTFSIATITAVLAIPIIGTPKQQKQYSESGTVVSFRTEVEQNVHGTDGDVNTTNVHRRVYRVQTSTTVYEFTGWENVFKQHGRPAMGIGEKIQFRVEGNKAHVLMSDGKEHTFLVLGAESKK